MMAVHKANVSYEELLEHVRHQLDALVVLQDTGLHEIVIMCCAISVLTSDAT